MTQRNRSTIKLRRYLDALDKEIDGYRRTKLGDPDKKGIDCIPEESMRNGIIVGLSNAKIILYQNFPELDRYRD